MKKKEFTDLKSKDLKDLKKLVFEKKADASKKRMSIKSGKDKNLKSYKNIRREIAKILTLIREKEIVEKIAKEKEVK